MNAANHRPNSFDEFVGKKDLVSSLKISIESSLINKQSLNHILFYGPPGIGKTSLAMIIGNELESKVHYVQGSCIQQYSDVLDMISMIGEHDILFIDEVHNINIKCFELFYSIMEDFVVDIKLGKDLNTQYTRLKLPQFTIIASTTLLSRLPSPFIERFPIRFYLEPYNIEEIQEILVKLNEKYHEPLINDDLELIAKHSKGIPRRAINIMKRFLEYKTVSPLTPSSQILQTIGIYAYGLEKLDIQYLKVLYKNYPRCIGLNQLTQQLMIDKKTIEEKIEPYLIQNDYIQRNTHGRLITQKGYSYISDLD